MCNKSLLFFLRFPIVYQKLLEQCSRTFLLGGGGGHKSERQAGQLCQYGKQVNHLFTTTVSRWSRVKNLPRDGTRTKRSGFDQSSRELKSCGGRDGENQIFFAHRIVFTMKRTITARPTQPHITPITMAVTSPARRSTLRVSTERKSSRGSLLNVSVTFYADDSFVLL